MATFVNYQDSLVACPFDANHRIAKRKLITHVLECSKKNKKTHVKCPYNASHYVLRNEIAEHLKHCHDSRRETVYNDMVKKMQQKKEEVGEQDWEDEGAKRNEVGSGEESVDGSVKKSDDVGDGDGTKDEWDNDGCGRYVWGMKPPKNRSGETGMGDAVRTGRQRNWREMKKREEGECGAGDTHSTPAHHPPNLSVNTVDEHLSAATSSLTIAGQSSRVHNSRANSRRPKQQPQQYDSLFDLMNSERPSQEVRFDNNDFVEFPPLGSRR